MNQSFYATSKIKDSRPIRDPAFQAECRADLTTFFQTQEVHFFSARCLTKPLRQDFEDMLRYLLVCLDGQREFSKSSTIFLSEAFDTVKRYYPFKVSKTTFDSAGAQHSWPILLALLHFLMKLYEDTLEYSIAVEDQEQANEVDADCYDLYYNGKDEELEARTASVLQEAMDLSIKYEKFSLECQQEMKSLTEQVENYHNTEQGIETDFEDTKAIDVKIDVCEAKLNKALSEKKAITQLLEKKKAQVAEVLEYQEKLEDEVTKQPLSKESAKKLVKETNDLRNNAHQLKEQAFKSSQQLSEVKKRNTNISNKIEQSLNSQRDLVLREADKFSALERYLNGSGTSIEGNDMDLADKTSIIVSYKALYLSKKKNQISKDIDLVKISVDKLINNQETPIKWQQSYENNQESFKKKFSQLKEVVKNLKAHIITQESDMKELKVIKEEIENNLEISTKELNMLNSHCQDWAESKQSRLKNLRNDYEALLEKVSNEFKYLGQTAKAQNEKRSTLLKKQTEVYESYASQFSS